MFELAYGYTPFKCKDEKSTKALMKDRNSIKIKFPKIASKLYDVSDHFKQTVMKMVEPCIFKRATAKELLKDAYF